jgi:hypothetical protein
MYMKHTDKPHVLVLRTEERSQEKKEGEGKKKRKKKKKKGIKRRKIATK